MEIKKLTQEQIKKEFNRSSLTEFQEKIILSVCKGGRVVDMAGCLGCSKTWFLKNLDTAKKKLRIDWGRGNEIRAWLLAKGYPVETDKRLYGKKSGAFNEISWYVFNQLTDPPKPKPIQEPTPAEEEVFDDDNNIEKYNPDLNNQIISWDDWRKENPDKSIDDYMDYVHTPKENRLVPSA